MHILGKVGIIFSSFRPDIKTTFTTIDQNLKFQELKWR